MMNTTTNNAAAETSNNGATTARKKWILLITIIFISITLTILSNVLVPGGDDDRTPSPTTAIINETCTKTLYPSLCFDSLSSFPPSIRITSPERLLEFSINGTARHVQDSRTKIYLLVNGDQELSTQEKNALNDCIEMLDQTLYELGQVSNGLGNHSELVGFHHQLYSEFKTLLSAAMTNENTCIEGVEDVANPGTRKGFNKDVQKLMNPVSKMISNCLAMAKYMESTSSSGGTRMMVNSATHGFPAWMAASDAKLMQIVAPRIQSNTTVAAAGHGNYRTINAAVRMAPSFSMQRYVIKIKAGVYNESVEIPREKSNIMLVGDGMDSTVITGCKNFLDGSSTFKSATLTVMGNRFLARDLTIINSSGPEKQQAVAVRVTSDSAFYKCNFTSFQDTLYVHSLRQFYRECTIQGTVDFIFGNAAAVFQNCLILVRKPIAGQKNMITAQGRDDPNQNTGIVLQNCTIEATPELIRARRRRRTSSYTFLGRPWRNHSRTVVMKSYLGDLIHPKGWYEWNQYSRLDTVEYIEYMNVGPGSDTRGRVTWGGGCKRNCSEDLVEQFTVGKFLHAADNWLQSTGFPLSSSS